MQKIIFIIMNFFMNVFKDRAYDKMEKSINVEKHRLKNIGAINISYPKKNLDWVRDIKQYDSSIIQIRKSGCALVSCFNILYLREIILIERFYRKCISIKAIRPDCYIRNYYLLPKALNLKAKFNRKKYTSKRSIDLIRLLNQDTPIIIFTKNISNHFLVIKGFNFEDGAVVFNVNDPAGREEYMDEQGNLLDFNYIPTGRKVSKFSYFYDIKPI